MATQFKTLRATEYPSIVFLFKEILSIGCIIKLRSLALEHVKLFTVSAFQENESNDQPFSLFSNGKKDNG